MIANDNEDLSFKFTATEDDGVITVIPDEVNLDKQTLYMCYMLQCILNDEKPERVSEKKWLKAKIVLEELVIHVYENCLDNTVRLN